MNDHDLTQYGVGYGAYCACRRCKALLKNVIAGCPCTPKAQSAHYLEEFPGWFKAEEFPGWFKAEEFPGWFKAEEFPGWFKA